VIVPVFKTGGRQVFLLPVGSTPTRFRQDIWIFRKTPSFRPYGAGSRSGSYSPLTRWAAFLRRFAASRTSGGGVEMSVENFFLLGKFSAFPENIGCMIIFQ